MHYSRAASDIKGVQIHLKSNVVDTICPPLDRIGLTNLPKIGTSGTPSSTIPEIDSSCLIEPAMITKNHK